MPKFTPKELDLDGTKYMIDIDKIGGGFSATWNCPLCHTSGRTGLSNGTEQGVIQVVADIVREHHAEKHALKP